MKKTYLLLLALISSYSYAQYCQPTFQYGTDGNMITRLIFGSIDNTSPFQSGTTPVYENFTAQSTQITAGFAYPISVKGPSSTFESDVMVYIDFNQNGNFEDVGEGFYLGRLAAANPANAHTITGNIVIPANAMAGSTTMRILKNTNVASMSNPQAPSSITGPCAALRSGQAEDYTVILSIPEPTCQGTDPGAITGDTSCITLTYKGSEVEYTTVRAADGNIWLQQNLGSNQVAASSTDTEAYGDLFQWGRWDDGHQLRTSLTSATAPVPNNPLGLQGGSENFYTTDPEWWNTNASTNDKWSASTPAEVTETNGCDPCKALGQNWRLPTAEEWQTVINNEQITNIATAYSSNLKLTIAGTRTSSGSLSNVGVRGYYWSSTLSDNTDFAKYLYYSNFIVNTTAGGFREQGGSIRCLKSLAPQPPASLIITTQNNAPATITTQAGTLQLVATVLPTGTNQGVIWTIQSGSGFATINQNGLVTATANGTITVQAVSTEDNSVFNSIQIIITNQIVVVENLEITVQDNAPAAITTNEGTLQLNAAVLPQQANQDVVWSITSGNEFATIDQNGLVTATANGTVTVQAVSAEDNTIADTIEITITGQIAPAQSLEITVQDNAEAKILVDNGSLQLIATILPANAVQDVEWLVVSGDEATVDESGLVTAQANGIVTIKAVSATDDSIFDEIEVLINNQNPSTAAPYCDVTAEFDVEPITLVQFAGINNATSELVNTTPAYENFTEIVGEVTKRQTYTLTVKGNTVGLHEHDIRVFIDWNQNNTFDMADEYYTTSITNSSGTDSTEATLDIEIPQTATLGSTRMRIIKDLWTAYEEGEFDGCTDAYYGQTEDYTLNITEDTMNTPDFTSNNFTVYPNPTLNDITVQSKDTVDTIRVYNIEGQLIATGKDNHVSLAKVATGMYIIKVQFKNGASAVQKIVKQ